MTLSDFEKRLQACNPKLHIKCYGSSMAGIHAGNQYVCRVPQGEITPYTVIREEIGHADQHKSDLNPTGQYVFKRIIKRGRNDVAEILHRTKLISDSDKAKIRN